MEKRTLELWYNYHMFKFEEKILDIITQRKEFLFFCTITLIAISIRLGGMEFISHDMKVFLLGWFDEMKRNGGINALSAGIGDYNLLYQTALSLMTYAKLSALYIIKFVNIFFDWILALGFAACAILLKQKRVFSMEWCFAYASVLLLPTVILNSSYWGQCDSMYTSFLVLTLLFLLKEKFLLTFICFGIALAFKLQAIFMLPFLICYYLYKRKFSLLMFFVSVFVFWLSGLVAYIKGQNLLTVFNVYFNQTDLYNEMYMNFCNFWMLVGNNYQDFKYFGIVLVVGLCTIGIYTVLTGKKKLDSPEQIINTSCWFLWTCLMFLPSMHERYAYPLDLFMLLLCFTDTKYIKYAITLVTISTITYGKYLCSNEIPYFLCVFMFITAYFHYTYSILKYDSVQIENKH